MRKCAKSSKNIRKCAKTWESMRKCAKSSEIVPKPEKVCLSMDQRVLYNKTRESVDAYADVLFDLQQQILTSRV